MQAFLESPRFNTEIRYGTVGGPEFSTDVVTVNSGAEQRNANWRDSRGKWQIADDLLNKAEMDWLIGFFRERKGRAGAFRFKDWSDWEARPLKANVAGVSTIVGFEGVFVEVPGSAGQLQLAKEYKAGIASTYRLISKPVLGTIKFWQGTTQVTGPSLDYSTGRVAGASTSMFWTGEFDVPARFDVDQFNAAFEGYRDSDGESLYSVAGVTIVELNNNPLANFIPSVAGVTNTGIVPGGLGTGSTAGISVQISATTLLGTASFATGNGTVNSPTMSVAAQGGNTSVPYQYQWECSVSPAPHTIIGSGTGSTLSVSAACVQGTDIVAPWRCKVTDLSGAVGYSPYCTVTLRSTLAASTAPAGGTMAVSLSAAIMYGNGSSYYAEPVTTFSPVYALPTGGAGFYQYQWQYVSGDASVTPTPATINSAGALFTAICLPGAPSKIAFFRCRVTDGVQVVFSTNVEVNLKLSDAGAAPVPFGQLFFG